MGPTMTIWYLVGIIITGGQPTVIGIESHNNYVSCFNARDNYLVQNELYTPADYAKHGVQFVCIAKDEEFN